MVTNSTGIRKSHGPDSNCDSVRCAERTPYNGDKSRCDGECGCCDPCTTLPLNIGIEDQVSTPDCMAYPCRCAPRGFVFTFTPDDPGNCKGSATTIKGVRDAGFYRATYSGTVPGIGVVGFYLERGGDLNDSSQFPPRPDGKAPVAIPKRQWRITFPDQEIDELYPFDDDIGCMTPPPLPSFRGSIGSHCGYPCEGTITISLWTEAKIPFYFGATRPGMADTVETSCTSCSEACTHWCMTRPEDPTPYDYGNLERTYVKNHRFEWNDYEGVFRGGLDCSESFGIEELEGKCYVRIGHLEEGTFDGDLIEINVEQCGSEIEIYAEDEDHFWFRLRCGACSCWDYACGRCRCICHDMCMVGVDGTTIIAHQGLGWNEDAVGWGDPNGGPDMFVGLGSEPVCGQVRSKCTLYIPGWQNADGSALDQNGGVTIGQNIPETCGSALSIGVEDASQLETYGIYRWRRAWCSNGMPCGVGQCLGQCDSLSPVVYADVSGGLWMPGAESPLFPKLIPATIPLFLVYVPQSAFQWGWTGSGVVQVYNYNPMDLSDFELVNCVLSIWVQCDSEVHMRLQTTRRLPGVQDLSHNWKEGGISDIPCTVCGTSYTGTYINLPTGAVVAAGADGTGDFHGGPGLWFTPIMSVYE